MPPEPIGDLAVKIWSEERQPLFFGGIFGDTLVDWKLIYIKISNLRGDVSPSLPHSMQHALHTAAARSSLAFGFWPRATLLDHQHVAVGGAPFNAPHSALRIAMQRLTCVQTEFAEKGAVSARRHGESPRHNVQLDI